MYVTCSKRDFIERDSSDFESSVCDRNVSETAELTSPASCTAASGSPKFAIAASASPVYLTGAFGTLFCVTALRRRYYLCASGECGVHVRSDCKPHYLSEVFTSVILITAAFACFCKFPCSYK